jgi:large subunit ribosomal protein L21e
LEFCSNLELDSTEHGAVHLSTFLTHYRVGDIVDIKANASQQKGMPHKCKYSFACPLSLVHTLPQSLTIPVYHGKTGIVYNVTARAVGVICYKVVNGRYLEKRVNLRVEHVKHSKCRQEFLDRVKSNALKEREAKEKGEHVQLKRLPAQPRESRVVSIKSNAPQTLTALPCEFVCFLGRCLWRGPKGVHEVFRLAGWKGVGVTVTRGNADVSQTRPLSKREARMDGFGLVRCMAWRLDTWRRARCGTDCYVETGLDRCFSSL